MTSSKIFSNKYCDSMPGHDICTIYAHNKHELEKIPAKYHCWNHTKYGFDVLPFIAIEEGATNEDIFSLRVAQLYHERGMMFGRKNHEKGSQLLLWDELPGFKFKYDEIKPIEPLVLATKMPQDPKNKLEMIMCDTDMSALGSIYFPYVSELLRLELGEDQEDWPLIQIEFLKDHKYHTEAARKFFGPQKQKNLGMLMKNAEEKGYDISKYLV